MRTVIDSQADCVCCCHDDFCSNKWCKQRFLASFWALRALRDSDYTRKSLRSRFMFFSAFVFSPLTKPVPAVVNIFVSEVSDRETAGWMVMRSCVDSRFKHFKTLRLLQVFWRHFCFAVNLYRCFAD